MEKIYSCLWFDQQGEEAAKFYVSIFPNSKILNVARYPESASKASGQPVGSVMTVDFELNGQRYMALNGGPNFKFTEAISLVVNCEDQAELDSYWARLTADGGSEVACGWLRDKYGLSWQLVPAELDKLMQGTPEQIERMMAAMMTMVKLDLEKLRAAWKGEAQAGS